MNYDAVLALYEALVAAKAVYDGSHVPALAHQVLSADMLSTKGAQQIPVRPYILVTPTTVQPAIRLPRNTNQGDVLVDNATRLAIVIESRARIDSQTAATTLAGYGAEHAAAVRFVRGLILDESSIDIPESSVDYDDGYNDGIASTTWDFRPDAGRFEGSTSQDAEGFQHIFFVRITQAELIWPQVQP